MTISKRTRAQVVELFDPRVPSAFWNKVIPEPNSGCWLWIAGLNTYGYGVFKINNHQRPAHRYILSIFEGERPSHVHVDHLCRTECCVNPAHLEFVSVKENARRGIKGVLTTHCPSGHEYTEENTRRSGGRRHCRTCASRRSLERWLIEKAERKARREAKSAARVEEGRWPE
jgi:hypothetical protein